MLTFVFSTAQKAVLGVEVLMLVAGLYGFSYRPRLATMSASGNPSRRARPASEEKPSRVETASGSRRQEREASASVETSVPWALRKSRTSEGERLGISPLTSLSPAIALAGGVGRASERPSVTMREIKSAFHEAGDVRASGGWTHFTSSRCITRITGRHASSS